MTTDNHAALIETPDGHKAEKVTKKDFKAFALSEGLHMCGTQHGRPLHIVLSVIDEHLKTGFPTREAQGPADKVRQEGTRLLRVTATGATRGIELDGAHKAVWKYRGFYIVHTHTLPDSRCSFESRLTVVYC